MSEGESSRTETRTASALPGTVRPRFPLSLLSLAEAVPPKRVLPIMLGLFVSGHAIYHLAGVRFDTTPLLSGVHIVDPALLRSRLTESLIYLHSQPPLLNLYLGMVLKLLPEQSALAFHLSYLAAGLLLYFSLFALMRRAGVSQGLALALSTWFMASPSFILHEHWLFTPLPLALLVTLSALAWGRTVHSSGWLPAFAFFSLLLLICLLHAMYHLVVFAVAAVVLLFLRRERRRTVALAALGPFLVLASLHLKNTVLFGQFSMSSWLGMNYAGVALRSVPLDDRRRLVAEAKLSPIALIPRFSPLDAYPPSYGINSHRGDVPVLYAARKSTGAPNYNHIGYLAISRQYMRDALYVTAHHPRHLLVGWLNAWLCYFRSTSDCPMLFGNLAKITPVNILYDYLCYGKIPFWRVRLGAIPIYYAPSAEPRLYLFLLVGLPALFVFGIRRGLRPDSGALRLSREQRMLVGYACANSAFVALVGNLLDVGENQRFRFATDPFFVMLLGLALQRRLGPVRGHPGAAESRRGWSAPRD